MEEVLPKGAPDEDIRVVRSTKLSQKQIDALDGAPVEINGKTWVVEIDDTEAFDFNFINN